MIGTKNVAIIIKIHEVLTGLYIFKVCKTLAFMINSKALIHAV